MLLQLSNPLKIAWRSLYATLLLLALPAVAQTIPKAVQKSADGTNAITESLTFGATRTLTLNGTFAGTPTGGTLDLSALTLTLPAASAVSGTTVNGYFADPSTNASFAAAAWRTDLALVPGTNVQAYSAALDTFAANGSAYYLARANHTGTQAWSTLTGTPTTLSGYGITDAQPLDSDLTAIAALSTTAYGRSTLSLADAAAGRTYFGVVIGTDVQAYDSDLAAIAALTTTAYGRGVLELADSAAAQTYFGITGGATNVTAAAVIADNSLLRGDGGARGAQDSGITVSDVASTNVTLSATTGNSLTLSTASGNKNVVIAPHGTGVFNISSTLALSGPSLVGNSATAGFAWEAASPNRFFAVGGSSLLMGWYTTGGTSGGLIQSYVDFRPVNDNSSTTANLGTSGNRWYRGVFGPNGVKIGDGTTGPTITSGSGSPEGVVTAYIGSMYMRTDGGAGTSLYVKESGTGNTGWVAK